MSELRTESNVAEVFPSQALEQVLMCESEVRVFVHLRVDLADTRQQVFGRLFAWCLQFEDSEIELSYVFSVASAFITFCI